MRMELRLDVVTSVGVCAEAKVSETAISISMSENLFIISDMEIDQATNEIEYCYDRETESYDHFKSLMERIRDNWERQTDIPFPKLYYWNVNARNNTILDLGKDVSYISGASPAILKQVLSGKTGWELCLEILLSDRYKVIK